MKDEQQSADIFYFKTGPCCAGCDHWHCHNALVGECTKSAPMPGQDRAAMIGITSTSLQIGAGHALTRRDHRCGEFSDTFDWATLPLAYVKRVGGKAPWFRTDGEGE